MTEQIKSKSAHFLNRHVLCMYIYIYILQSHAHLYIKLGKERQEILIQTTRKSVVQKRLWHQMLIIDISIYNTEWKESHLWTLRSKKPNGKTLQDLKCVFDAEWDILVWETLPLINLQAVVLLVLILKIFLTIELLQLWDSWALKPPGKSLEL